jgi:MFS family permease
MNRAFRVLFFFTAAYFLSYFYRSANAIIAPDLSLEIGLTAADLGLITSLFFASFALVQLPLGAALDAWGPRWVVAGLMLSAVAGSLVFASAHSLVGLAVGRALIGIGMSGILMGALKAFSAWFPPQRYATVSSLLIGIGSTGALFASTPLALLNQSLGWRSVFFLGAGVVALVALSIAVFTRSGPPGEASYAHTSTASQGSAASGNAQKGGWSTIFRSLAFWRIAPLIFFTNGTMLAFQGLWSGPYLFDVLGLDQVPAGSLLLLLSLGVSVGYGISGWLSDRFGLSRVIALGCAICTATMFVLALRPPAAVVALTLPLFGVFGAFAVMLLVQPRSVFPPHLMGRAVTAVNVFSIGGTFLLQWIMGMIINTFPSTGGQYPPEAHSAALFFTGAGSLLALLWYLPMLRRAPLPAARPSPNR